MITNQHRKFFTIAILTVMVAAFFVLLIVVFQREENKSISLESNVVLEAVATSKQQQLSDWLSDEIHDAGLIISDGNLVETIIQYVEDKKDDSALLTVFNQIKAEHGYAELVLLNETGDYLTSTNQALTFNDSIDKKIVAKALKTDSCYISDVYRSSVDQNIYVDLVSIVRDNHGKPIGGLVFKFSSKKTMDNMLNDWMLANYRCIVSLIQQQENSTWIVYKPDSSFTSGQSCWKPLPARFKNNPFEQRHKWVRISGMPNSFWYLMVELDNSQRKAETGTYITLLSVFGVASVLIFFLGLLFISYFQETKATQQYRDKELECNRINDQFVYTMDLLGEAVLITDNQGLIQYMNLAAELVSGCSLKDVKGKLLDKEIPLLQEASGLPLLNVKNWFSGERAYNQFIPAFLIDKNGTHIQVTCSIAPLKSDSLYSNGLVLIISKESKKHFITPETPDSTEIPSPKKTTKKELGKNKPD